MEISCSGDGPPNTTAQRSDIITSLLGGSSVHCGASAPARSRVVVRKIVLVEYDAALSGDGRGQPDGLLPPVDDVRGRSPAPGPGWSGRRRRGVHPVSYTPLTLPTI